MRRESPWLASCFTAANPRLMFDHVKMAVCPSMLTPTRCLSATPGVTYKSSLVKMPVGSTRLFSDLSLSTVPMPL